MKEVLPWISSFRLQLETKLEDLEHVLSEYGLPLFKHDWVEALNRTSAYRILSSNPFIAEQPSYNVYHEKTAYETKYTLLNIDQKNAFDTIISSIETTPLVDPSSSSQEGSTCFFLHGSGGNLANTLCQISLIIWDDVRT
jgi:hypothetical protein